MKTLVSIKVFIILHLKLAVTEGSETLVFYVFISNTEDVPHVLNKLKAL